MSEAELVRSVRQAAAASGVSPFVVRRWISQGMLDEPPWTLDEVQEARDTEHRGPRSQAAHGSTARWNAGCSCANCRTAHSDDGRARKRATAQARLPAYVRQRLVAAIYAGQPFRAALRNLGLTSNQVFGLSKTDEDWSTPLEASLTVTRRDDLQHATNAAYVAGCVCQECREHQRLRMARNHTATARSNRQIQESVMTDVEDERHVGW